MRIDWFQLALVVLPILLSAVIAGMAYLYKSERDRREGVERQLSEQKYDLYMKLMEVFSDILHGETPAPPETVTRFNEVNRKLIIYGSDRVFNAFQDFLKLAAYQEDEALTGKDLENKHGDFNKSLERAIGTVILAIRKDMGNQKTRVKPDELFYQFDLAVNKIGVDSAEIK